MQQSLKKLKKSAEIQKKFKIQELARNKSKIIVYDVANKVSERKLTKLIFEKKKLTWNGPSMQTAFRNSKRDRKEKRIVIGLSKFLQKSAINSSVKETYIQIGNAVESSTTRQSRGASSVRDSGISGKSIVRRKSVSYALKLSTAIRTV